MAKRKKTKSYRRRRVSGVGKISAGGALTDIGGVLLGVAAAGYLNKLALSGKSSTVQALVPLGIGIAVPMFMKNQMGKAIGAGAIAYGGSKFLANMGLAGVGDADTLDIPVRIAGDDSLSIVAGDDDFAMAGDDALSALAGIDDED